MLFTFLRILDSSLEIVEPGCCSCPEEAVGLDGAGVLSALEREGVEDPLFELELFVLGICVDPLFEAVVLEESDLGICVDPELEEESGF